MEIWERPCRHVWREIVYVLDDVSIPSGDEIDVGRSGVVAGVFVPLPGSLKNVARRWRIPLARPGANGRSSEALKRSAMTAITRLSGSKGVVVGVGQTHGEQKAVGEVVLEVVDWARARRGKVKRARMRGAGNDISDMI